MLEEIWLRGGPRDQEQTQVSKGTQYLTFMRLRRQKKKNYVERLTYRRIWNASGQTSVFSYMVEKRG